MIQVSSCILLTVSCIWPTLCLAQEQSRKKDILPSFNADPCADVLFVDSCTIAVYQGRVIEVPDGQTVVMILNKALGQSNLADSKSASGKKIRLRLAGISAPALKDKFGKESKRRLEHFLLNRMISVTAFCAYIDGKEGWRAAVEYGDIDVGKEQIKSGFARFDGSTVDVQEYRGCHYRLAEKKAQLDRKGIWRELAK